MEASDDLLSAFLIHALADELLYIPFLDFGFYQVSDRLKRGLGFNLRRRSVGLFGFCKRSDRVRVKELAVSD